MRPIHVSGLTLGLLTLAGAAVAAEEEVGTDIEEVVVTGSRIARSGFTAPTPVTFLGGEQMEQRAITNVGEALNELPLFRALISPATQQAQGGKQGKTVHG